jgi:hypothetical protein
MSNQLKPGDKVQLISGSNTMTVAWVEDRYASVAYWNPSTHEIIHIKVEKDILTIVK